MHMKGTGKDLVQHRIQLKPPVVVAAGERLGMLLHCKEGKIAVTGRGPADVEVEGFKIVRNVDLSNEYCSYE